MGEKYLAEAVKSILFQTYTNWELIFWDNQSTDNSSTIVNSYGIQGYAIFMLQVTLIWEKLGTSALSNKGRMDRFYRCRRYMV